MTFALSGDWSGLIDGLQPVTLLRPGTSLSLLVPHALCRVLKGGEAEATAAWNTQCDVVWHLPAEELAQTPRTGDLLVDADGRRWTVLSARAAAMATRWRCVARDLAAAHDLRETVRVERADYAKGDGGAEEIAWRLWKAGVRARILPVAQETLDEHERTVTATTVRILVAEDLELDHACRLRGPDGKTYRVQTYRKAQRIDDCGEITAVTEGERRTAEG